MVQSTGGGGCVTDDGSSCGTRHSVTGRDIAWAASKGSDLESSLLLSTSSLSYHMEQQSMVHTSPSQSKINHNSKKQLTV